MDVENQNIRASEKINIENFFLLKAHWTPTYLRRPLPLMSRISRRRPRCLQPPRSAPTACNSPPRRKWCLLRANKFLNTVLQSWQTRISIHNNWGLRRWIRSQHRFWTIIIRCGNLLLDLTLTGVYILTVSKVSAGYLLLLRKYALILVALNQISKTYLDIVKKKLLTFFFFYAYLYVSVFCHEGEG